MGQTLKAQSPTKTQQKPPRMKSDTPTFMTEEDTIAAAATAAATTTAAPAVAIDDDFGVGGGDVHVDVDVDVDVDDDVHSSAFNAPAPSSVSGVDNSVVVTIQKDDQPRSNKNDDSVFGDNDDDDDGVGDGQNSGSSYKTDDLDEDDDDNNLNDDVLDDGYEYDESDIDPEGMEMAEFKEAKTRKKKQKWAFKSILSSKTKPSNKKVTNKYGKNSQQLLWEKKKHLWQATQSSCDQCGRTASSFITALGFEYHLQNCTGKQGTKPNTPWSVSSWKCTVCGKHEFTTQQAFSAHQRCCTAWNENDDAKNNFKVDQCQEKPQQQQQQHSRNHVDSVNRQTTTLPPISDMNDEPRDPDAAVTMSLHPEYLHSSWEKLSDFNQHLTNCIELIEATTIEVNRQARRNRRRPIDVGNIGIRCIYCAQHKVDTIGSTTYADSVKTLPHNMYVMVSRHLLVTCPYIPKIPRSNLLNTKHNSLSQTMTLGHIGLPAYLRMLQDEFGLEDIGHANGVRVRCFDNRDGAALETQVKPNAT
jgi:hypothetical protein